MPINSVFKTTEGGGNYPKEFSTSRNALMRASGFDKAFDEIFGNLKFDFNNLVIDIAAGSGNKKAFHIQNDNDAKPQDLGKADFQEKVGYEGSSVRKSWSIVNGKLVNNGKESKKELEMNTFYNKLVNDLNVSNVYNISISAKSRIDKQFGKGTTEKLKNGTLNLAEYQKKANDLRNEKSTEWAVVSKKWQEIDFQERKKKQPGIADRAGKQAVKDYLMQEMVAGYYKQYLDFANEIIGATDDVSEEDFFASLRSRGFGSYIQDEQVGLYRVRDNSSGDARFVDSAAENLKPGENYEQSAAAKEEGSDKYYLDSDNKNSLLYFRGIFKSINQYAQGVMDFIETLDEPGNILEGQYGTKASGGFQIAEDRKKYIEKNADFKKLQKAARLIKASIDDDKFKGTRVQEMVKKFADDKMLYNFKISLGGAIADSSGIQSLTTLNYTGAGNDSVNSGSVFKQEDIDLDPGFRLYNALYGSGESYKNFQNYKDLMQNRSENEDNNRFAELAKNFMVADDKQKLIYNAYKNAEEKMSIPDNLRITLFDKNGNPFTGDNPGDANMVDGMTAEEYIKQADDARPTMSDDEWKQKFWQYDVAKQKKDNPVTSISLFDAFMKNDKRSVYLKQLYDAGKSDVISQFFKNLDADEDDGGSKIAIAYAGNLGLDERLKTGAGATNNDAVRQVGSWVSRFGKNADVALEQGELQSGNHGQISIPTTDSDHEKTASEISMFLRQSVRELKENFIDIWSNYDYIMHGKSAKIAYLTNFNLIGIGARKNSPAYYLTMNEGFSDPNADEFSDNVSYMFNILAEASGGNINVFKDKNGDKKDIKRLVADFQTKIRENLQKSNSKGIKPFDPSNFDFTEKLSRDVKALGFGVNKEGKPITHSKMQIQMPEKFRNCLVNLRSVKSKSKKAAGIKDGAFKIRIKFSPPAGSYADRANGSNVSETFVMKNTKQLTCQRNPVTGIFSLSLQLGLERGSEKIQFFRRNIGSPAEVELNFSTYVITVPSERIYLKSFSLYENVNFTVTTNSNQQVEGNMCEVNFEDYTGIYSSSNFYACANGVTNSKKVFREALKPLVNLSPAFYPDDDKDLDGNLDKIPKRNYIINNENWQKYLLMFVNKYGYKINNALVLKKDASNANDPGEFVLESKVAQSLQKKVIEDSRARERTARWLQYPVISDMTITKKPIPNYLSSSTITLGYRFDSQNHEKDPFKIYKYPAEYNAASLQESSLIAQGITSIQSKSPHKLDANADVINEEVTVTTLKQEYSDSNVNVGGAGTIRDKFYLSFKKKQKSEDAAKRAGKLIKTILELMTREDIYLDKDFPLFNCYSIIFHEIEGESNHKAGVYFRSTATGDSSDHGIRGMYGLHENAPSATTSGERKEKISQAFFLNDDSRTAGVTDQPDVWLSVPTELCSYFPLDGDGKSKAPNGEKVANFNAGSARFVREVFYTNKDNSGFASFNTWTLRMVFQLKFAGSERSEIEYENVGG